MEQITYSEKQIKKAFLQWRKDIEKNPDDFMSDEEISSKGAKELSEKDTESLIKYLK